MRPYLGHSEPRVQAPADAAPIIICPGRRSNIARNGITPLCFPMLHRAASLCLFVCKFQHAMRPAGFGNEANDYIAPDGRLELGMVSHLQVTADGAASCADALICRLTIAPHACLSDLVHASHRPAASGSRCSTYSARTGE